MATFDSDTQANINSARDTTDRKRTDWHEKAGSAIKDMADNLGDSALKDATTDGEGDLLRLNASDDKLPLANLPDDIDLSRLPTGATAGLIPLIQSNGKLLSSIIGVSADALKPAADKVTRRLYTEDATWTKPDDLIYVFVRLVGGGGRFGGRDDTAGADSTGLESFPVRAYPRCFIIPAWRLGATEDVVVGQSVADCGIQRGAPGTATYYPPLGIRTGESRFGDAYAAGGTSIEQQKNVRFNARGVNMNRTLTNFTSRSGGVSNVEGVNDPTNTASAANNDVILDRGGRRMDRLRESVNYTFTGFGSPNNPGFVEIFEVVS